MTNIAKAKSLRIIRKRLEWSQAQMAGALGLDPTYLSQLENARRPVDDWYLQRAEEIAKSKDVKQSEALQDKPPERYRTTNELRQDCHEYLDRILDRCAGDYRQLNWLLIELQRHFPINSGPLSEEQHVARRAAGEESRRKP